MKIKQYYSWMVAAAMAVATPFLAACSSEENLAPSRGVAVTDAHIVIWNLMVQHPLQQKAVLRRLPWR